MYYITLDYNIPYHTTLYYTTICYTIFSMALQAHLGHWPPIRFRNHFFTDGRTQWTSDQLVARPLHKRRTTQSQNKRIHTSNIHALSGTRNHDPSVRASEDIACLRPRGYCDRLTILHYITLYTLYYTLYYTILKYERQKNLTIF
jgi:hypothetical protein